MSSLFKKLASRKTPLASGTPKSSKAKKLRDAADKGNIEVVREIIQAGTVNVNAAGWEGWTALHHAARNNFPEIVQLLLEAGADRSIVNNSGLTVNVPS